MKKNADFVIRIRNTKIMANVFNLGPFSKLYKFYDLNGTALGNVKVELTEDGEEKTLTNLLNDRAKERIEKALKVIL